jgi:hypothetical protein
MSSRTTKRTATVSNGSLPAKRAKTAKNSATEKPAAKKKSINERWIEKYGVDESKSAKLLLRAWNKTYENRHKRID